MRDHRVSTVLPATDMSAPLPHPETEAQADEWSILRTALRIEHCRRRALHWYWRDAISEFHGMTARDMCTIGEGNRVIRFLQRILRDQDG